MQIRIDETRHYMKKEVQNVSNYGRIRLANDSVTLQWEKNST